MVYYKPAHEGFKPLSKQEFENICNLLLEEIEHDEKRFPNSKKHCSFEKREKWEDSKQAKEIGLRKDAYLSLSKEYFLPTGELDPYYCFGGGYLIENKRETFYFLFSFNSDETTHIKNEGWLFDDDKKQAIIISENGKVDIGTRQPDPNIHFNF